MNGSDALEYTNINELDLPKTKKEKLLGMLRGCEYCCGSYDREDNETYFFGPHESFEELLDDIGFSEKQKEIIYNDFTCPNCSCNLDAYSEVVINEYYKEEKWHEKYMKKIFAKVESEIEDFYDYLVKYPYLGCNHPVGKEIIKGIDALEKTTIENTVYYRARMPSDSSVFSNKDMLPPNPVSVKISEGRFNHYGQSHWYLGDSINLCGAECSQKKNCIIWYQKINIKKALNILDLTKDYFDYYYNPYKTEGYNLPIVVAALLVSGVITKEQKIKGSWKPEYFITRFISDICKVKGIQGIIYPNSIYPSGKNLVIFDISNIEYEFIGNPKLKEFKNTESVDTFYQKIDF